jgi:hypothetical protein
VLASAGKNSLANLSLGVPGMRMFNPTPVITSAQFEPFLLGAKVPRELVLAFVIAGPEDDKLEVFVDFEKLTPDMVQDFTPMSYVRANAPWREQAA